MITFFLTATDVNGKPVDIVDALRKSEFAQENKEMATRCGAKTSFDIDLEKASPKFWKQIMDDEKKIGYRVMVHDNVKDKVLAKNTPEGVADVKWELVNKKDEPKKLVNRKDAPKSPYNWYRRDYTQAELDEVSKPNLMVDQRGEVYWFGSDHESVADFYSSAISEGLSDLIIKEHVHWNWSKDSGCDNYYKGGELSTPDGKPCKGVLFVSEKQLPKGFEVGKPCDKDVKITLRLGKDQKISQFYARPNLIYKMPDSNKLNVYFTKDECNVYNLKDKTKSVMTIRDLRTAQEDAKSAYSEQKRKEAQITIKDIPASDVSERKHDYVVNLRVPSDVSSSGYASILCDKHTLVGKDVKSITFDKDHKRYVMVENEQGEQVKKTMLVSELSAARESALEMQKSNSAERSNTVDKEFDGVTKESGIETEVAKPGE